MQVRSLTVRDFRNHDRAEFGLGEQVTVVEGAVGAGKTNLLEALFVACTGRSFRTSHDREVIHFEAPFAQSRVTILDDGGITHRLEVTVQRDGGKVMTLDGARVERARDVDVRPLMCLFAPDRLELVKAAAGVRRAHLDEVVAALWPARRETRQSYARALAQRNSLLTRARAGRVAADSMAGWTQELAKHGAQLMADRSEAVSLLSPWFSERAGELGLEGETELAYKPRSRGSTADELRQELEAALPNDLERGFTTHGPHRDELAIELDRRLLRNYGSQGQQRLGLLALLLAERDVLAAARTGTPMLLLDDVMSELDGQRRELLLDLLDRGGQSLITTADPGAVGLDRGFARVRVSPGEVAALEQAPA
jgi:DNA replication and repair protein RecF